MEANVDMRLRNYNDRVRRRSDYKSGFSFTRMGLQQPTIQYSWTGVFVFLNNLVFPLIPRHRLR